MKTLLAVHAPLTVLIAALLCIPVDATAQDEQQTTAVWKQRDMDFHYRSSRSVYSCSAIEARVATILRAVGARDDVRVQAHDCDNVMIQPDPRLERLDPWNSRDDVLGDRRYPRREQFVRVRMQFAMPIEATPEVVAEIEKNKTKRELIARVTNNPAAALEGAVQFPAHWQEVTISNKTIGVEAEECELLEQMSQSVLRRLDVRIKRRSFTCSPNHQSRIPPKMTVEALLPSMPAVRAPNLEPADPAEEEGEQPTQESETGSAVPSTGPQTPAPEATPPEQSE